MPPPDIQPGDALTIVAWWKKGPDCIVDAKAVRVHDREVEVLVNGDALRHYVSREAVVSVNGVETGATT